MSRCLHVVHLVSVVAILFGPGTVSGQFSAQGSCDFEYTLQAIGGIKDFRAQHPEKVAVGYKKYKPCVGPESSKEEFRTLVQLGIAYLHAVHPMDSVEYELLLQASRSRSDHYCEGVLLYRGAIVKRLSSATKFSTYKEALGLIQRSDSAISAVAARLQANLAKYIIRLDYQGDWKHYLENSIDIYEQLSLNYEVVERSVLVAQDLIQFKNDTATARTILDSALAFAKERTPHSLPIILNCLGYYYNQLEKRSEEVASYAEGTNICLQQIKGGSFSEDCFVVIMNYIVFGHLVAKDLVSANQLVEQLPQFITIEADNCNYLLLQSQIKRALGNAQMALTFVDWADECYTLHYGRDHINKVNIFDARLDALNGLGDLNHSIRVANEAISFSRKHRLQLNADKVLTNLAIDLAEGGRLDKARSIFESDTIYFPNNYFNAWNRGIFYHLCQDWTKSNEFFGSALEKSITREERCGIYGYLAMNARSQGNLDLAQKYAQQGFDELHAPRFVQQELSEPRSDRFQFNERLDELQVITAEIHMDLYHRTNEKAHLDTALALTNMSERQLNGLVLAGFGSKALYKRMERATTLRLEAASLLNGTQEERAEVILRTSESMRSRDMLALLTRSEFTQRSRLLEFDSARIALNSRIEAYKDSTRYGGKWVDHRPIVEDMTKLQEQLSDLVGSRGTVDAMIDSSSLSLSAARAWCKEHDTQMISYLFADSSLYVLLIAPTIVDVVTKDLSAEQVTRSLTETGSDPRGSGDKSYRSLSSMLLPAGLKGKGRLMILPDGPLNQLPFECLPVPDDSGDLLSDRFDISYSFSLAISMKDRPTSGQRGLLTLAPTYTLADSSQTNTTARSRWLFSRSAAVKQACTPLPGSQQQASTIAEWFNGTALLDTNATEKNFTDALKRNYGSVLLNVHGFTYDVDPMLSGLVFSDAFGTLPQDTVQTFDPVFFQNDGILHAFEVYDMDLDLDLVVLSACHSGTGKYQEGEGTMSLARAFMAAGARSVVMSLWQVDNESTIEIVQSFMEYLADGMRKSAALNQAKKDYRKAHPTAPSYYWAGLVLVGSDAPLSVPGTDRTWWWIAGLLAAIVGVGVWKRRSNLAKAA